MLKVLSFAMVSVAAATQTYTSAKVGEFVAPNPPATETTHLKHLNLAPGDKLPAPEMSLETETSFMEVSASASEAAVEPQRVPHNWFVTFLLYFIEKFLLFVVFVGCVASKGRKRTRRRFIVGPEKKNDEMFHRSPRSMDLTLDDELAPRKTASHVVSS